MIKEKTKPKSLDISLPLGQFIHYINLPLGQFIHHVSRMDYSGIEPERLP